MTFQCPLYFFFFFFVVAVAEQTINITAISVVSPLKVIGD